MTLSSNCLIDILRFVRSLASKRKPRGLALQIQAKHRRLPMGGKWIIAAVRMAEFPDRTVLIRNEPRADASDGIHLRIMI